MIARARRLAFSLYLALSVVIGLGPALAPMPAMAQGQFDDAKYAAIVIDANTGEVLYAKRADSPRYPASITKILTLYLTFDALASGRLHLNDRVVISPRAAAQAPSKLGLAAGQTLSVEEAIHAIAIKSANDIAVAMSEKIGGTESRFAALMTVKAQELGMTNSRFVNASGLPDSRQLTSARDIAILSRAVMRDFPQYYPYFSQQTWNWRGQTLRNHNGLLFRMAGVDGIKTGFTNASGFNLAASAVRDGRRLICVVMGGATTRGRDNHVASLLDTGFDVLRRRERGELITVAQSEFEKADAPAGPVAYASMAPAAEDITGALNAAIRPAMNTQPRPAPARVLAPPVKAQAPVKKAAPRGAYAIQVGSFRSKGDAQDWLGETGKRFGKSIDGEGHVVSFGGRHRTMYTGMSKDAANSACKQFKAKRLACMVTGSVVTDPEPVSKKASGKHVAAKADTQKAAAKSSGGKAGAKHGKAAAKPAAKAKKSRH